MKPILATIALLFLLGCQSKPKPPYPIDQSGNVTLIFNDPAVHHVTREQWEAAQGLYNPHLNGAGTYYGGRLPIEGPPIDDTGNAWTNIDGVNPRKATISCSKGYHLIFHPDTNTICCTPDYHPSDIHHFDTFPPSGDAK